MLPAALGPCHSPGHSRWRSASTSTAGCQLYPRTKHAAFSSAAGSPLPRGCMHVTQPFPQHASRNQLRRRTCGAQPAAAGSTAGGTYAQASQPSLEAAPGPDEIKRRLQALGDKLAVEGIEIPNKPTPGVWYRGLCPFCEGGSATEKSFSITISEGVFAQAACGS